MGLNLVLAKIDEAPDYYVDNYGDIWVKKNGVGLFKIVQTKVRGYMHFTRTSKVSKKLKTFRVHRLVAKYFCANPYNKPHVNHINGVKHDNRAINLEWVTKSENEIHKNRVLEKRTCHKLTKEIAINIYKEANEEINSQEEIAKKYNISRRMVGMIKSGKRWSFYTDAITKNKI